LIQRGLSLSAKAAHPQCRHLGIDLSADRAGRSVVLYTDGARPDRRSQRHAGTCHRAKEDCEMATKKHISRRTVLAALPAAVVVVAQPRCVVSDAEAAAPRRVNASWELRTLIEAHKVAYRQFIATVVDRSNVSERTSRAADRVEQKALLAVCSYPAIEIGDRRAKARYLLAIEARGELDLPEHMQAILRSMRNG
jgi:hypothetical protein